MRPSCSGGVRKFSVTRLEEHTCEASTTCFLSEGQESHLHAPHTRQTHEPKQGLVSNVN